MGHTTSLLSLLIKRLSIAGIAICASACILDGDTKNSNQIYPLPETDWAKDVYEPAEQYRHFCASPRKGSNPVTNERYPDRQGSTEHEKHYLRAWTNENYLWYREVNDINPANAQSTLEYFDNLKTFAKNADGKDKDQFHFYNEQVIAQQNENNATIGGFGASYKVVGNRIAYLAYVEPGSPAEAEGLKRGMQVTHLNDIAIASASQEQVALFNEALFYPHSGKQYKLTHLDDNQQPFTTTFTAGEVKTSANIAEKIIETASGPVGYLHFKTFYTRESELEALAAMTRFKEANINDLVLDLRYNTGGFLFIASQMSYMIAGGNITAGKIFEALKYNDKRSNENFTLPFHSVTTQEPGRPSVNLPALNLSRVYILGTKETASASEALINGLRGIGIEVFLFGENTQGKPYGFTGNDNCGYRYFSIEFEGVNEQGFGAYAGGFIPSPTDANNFSARVTGCPVSDDFSKPLGDENEAMLQTALHYRSNGSCPPESNATSLSKPSASGIGVIPFLTPPALQGHRIITTSP